MPVAQGLEETSKNLGIMEALPAASLTETRQLPPTFSAAGMAHPNLSTGAVSQSQARATLVGTKVGVQ